MTVGAKRPNFFAGAKRPGKGSMENEAIFYRILDSHNEEYPINIQQIKRYKGQEIYSGEGRFCKSMDGVFAYLKSKGGLHVTRADLAERLNNGEPLKQIFPIVEGEDCHIGKVSPDLFDVAEPHDIVYIPDLDFSEIPYSRPVTSEEAHNILMSYYTKQDFIDATYGIEEAAHDLFKLCNWQHPDLQDLLDGIDSGVDQRDYDEDLMRRVEGIAKESPGRTL